MANSSRLTRSHCCVFLQSNKFVEGRYYDPNCYLLMSKANDLSDLAWRGSSPLGTDARPGESYLDALLRIQSKLLVIGVTSDMIMPIAEQQEIFSILSASGHDVRFKEIHSSFGHDAFIVDEGLFVPEIKNFLRQLDCTPEQLRRGLCG
eukprot:TRINITY_DN2222_c0_g1_i2.p1 TRINITY_DN2222_c0_g1~~TRINITY_DN2222_c0_g1_i2.p1  ORF type:complete len:149 (-),score=36.02 TRINITY_DN2222_c0_g1_i2:148-594(-)